MINIQDIIPFMRKGWVAMDKNKQWWFFGKKPKLTRKVWLSDGNKEELLDKIDEALKC